MWSTDRLIIRHFILEDSQFILDLVNSEPWLTNIGDRGIYDSQAANVYLNKLIKFYELQELGLSCIVLKSNPKPIGICGLIRREEFNFPDLGYALLPEFFGYGYAFEAAEKIKDLYLEQSTSQKLLAIVKPTNKASINLLVKLGFSISEQEYSADPSLTVYQLKTFN